MAKERKCIFCGKTYEYCGHCKEYSNEPEWKFNFDSEKCHDLYEAVAAYKIGVGTIENVKATLDKHNVVDYSIFSKGLQDELKKLEPKTETKEINDEVKNEPKKGEVYIHNKFKKSNKKYDNERRVNTEE